LKRALIIVASAAAALLLAAAAGYARFGREVAVAVVEASQGSLPYRVVGPGTVQARIPVTLSARITATVSNVHVDVGDAVRRGQELVRLDERDLAARRGVVAAQVRALSRHVDAAKAALDKAQADLQLARTRQRRDAELLRTGFLSDAVLDTSNAALQAAAAGVDNARAALRAREAEAQAMSEEARYADTMLSHARLIAPMDGVVISRQAEVGSTVVPGSALLRMVDPATLWVAVRVDESVVGRVEVGQQATIRLRTGEILPGKVARIARQSDAATRELEVDVAFDRPPARFAIDQEADVSIVAGQASGIVLPLTSLTRDPAGRQGVLVVVDSRAEFRPVVTDTGDGRLALVLHGLAAGERVIVRADAAKAGMRVKALDPGSL
jgi:HlyD family secretion protein